MFYNSDFKAAIKTAEKIKEENLKMEKWILPASILIIAESYFQLNKITEAASYLKQAEESNEFEFAELFDSKIMNLRRRMDSAKK